MADDEEKAELALSTPEARERYALRLAGQLPPNECRFKCVTCEFDQTMQFEDDEMEALNNDVTSYTGPCPKCGKMTLLPFDKMFEDSQGIYSRAKENRRAEYEEQADVMLDKVEGRVAKVLGGAMGQRMEQAPATPGGRDDLPPADDLDLTDLKGRPADE